MNDIIQRVLEGGNEPTRVDIADLLSSIAPPGEKLDEKTAAVETLYEVTGHRSTNSQGHSVIGILDSFGEF